MSEKLRWAQLKNHVIVIRLLSALEDIDGSSTAPRCQILYLDAHTADRLWPFTPPKGVLTVSNQKGFAIHGGMIEFVWDSSDTYRIALNLDSVRASGLIISGALGTLADRVDDARFAP